MRLRSHSVPPAILVLSVSGVLLVLAGVVVHASGADPAWMLAVHTAAPTPAEVVAWSCVTVLGLGWAALILMMAADRGAGMLAALVPLAFALGGLLTHLPKLLLAHPRPAATGFATHLHVIGHAFIGPVSMPSGHALTVAAAAALLCAAAPFARSMLLRAVILLAAAIVAWSRVAVGAHWPSDVLVGAGLGLLAVAIVLLLAGMGRWHAWLAGRIRTPAGQRWTAILELAFAAGLLHERTGYPAAQPMVLLLACLAVVSAAVRWQAIRHARAAAKAREWPARST